jgi:hypothetical protein
MDGARAHRRRRDHARMAARRGDRRAASPHDLAQLVVLLAMLGVILVLVVTMGASLPYA